ncbi:phosphatidylglycerophosphatase A [Candidatus Neomarinimicrobiota bacterium]
MTKHKLAYWIASVVKIGQVPFAPGTAGSFVAMVMWYIIIDYLNPYSFILITLIIFAVGVYTSSIVVRHNNKSDPPQIVIDEWIGQWITLFLLPKSILWGFIGFVYFRVFDILKPGPVKLLDQMPGGWGIMLDDIAAGIFAFLLLQLSLVIFL